MIRIAQVAPGSIAEELQLQIGSRIVRVNGAPVRDGIDFRFLEAEAYLELEVAPEDAGRTTLYEIEKDAGECLGVVPETDTVRQCANKCVFCFVDGNPDRARSSLHLKDDDFRLSFTYGSYITLTNLGAKGIRRLIEQRLSPLYVSVHATDPEMRMALLGVRLGGDIVERLRELTASGIEVHTQIVLCPGWNDGTQLDRTVEDLWGLGPSVLSLSVVPVGLTRYNLGRPVRLMERDEAARALRQIEGHRTRAYQERGEGWVYAADELFFIAAEPCPPAAYYDDWPLTENGVGAVRRFLDGFERGVDRLPWRGDGRIALVTGTRMAPILEDLAPRLVKATGAQFDVVGVENRMFGPTVNTAGLLPGRDILDSLKEKDGHQIILLPAESLNDDSRFVDDVALDVLKRELAPARVVTGHEITATLAQAL